MALVSGPAAAGSGSNTLADGSEQSFAGANYVLRFEMTFPASQAAQSRKEDGWLWGLQNGANATRYDMETGQMKTPADVGLSGEVWSGGGFNGSWELGTGTAGLTTSVVKGGTIIYLADEKWGHSAEVGDWVGFTSYFGAHRITEVQSAGVYRVAPPLRAALTKGTNRATLRPRLAIRPVPGSINYGSYNPAYASEKSAQFIEVPDEYIDTYFGD